jgi:hypothetical protein
MDDDDQVMRGSGAPPVASRREDAHADAVEA